MLHKGVRSRDVPRSTRHLVVKNAWERPPKLARRRHVTVERNDKSLRRGVWRCALKTIGSNQRSDGTATVPNLMPGGRQARAGSDEGKVSVNAMNERNHAVPYLRMPWSASIPR